MATYPLLMEPDELERHLGEENLLVIDLCKPEVFAQGHIAGAVHLDYAQVVTAEPPVMGLLPNAAQMSALLSAIGVTPDTHVVAYDDEGGGRAARLLWSLAAYGHGRYSLLNGGLHAWANEGHPLTQEPSHTIAGDYQARYVGDVVADRDYIKAHLKDEDVALLDARSPGEFDGSDKRAQHGGHIPGAVNLEWTQMMDPSANLRIKPRDQLLPLLEHLGITPDKEVIAYCQTHHRSALSWLALKALGFERVRGYPGAWSDWGNRSDTPIEH